ncbi:MAG: VWA domain-containing protein [Nitrospirae bacterium]|nr:VWA domain-containing protein [Nitrospirota bacterium]
MGDIRPAGLCLICLLMILSFAALPTPLICADIGGFRVEQASVELPNIKVYAEILDSIGAAIDNNNGDNETTNFKISASVGAASTKTRGLVPFTQSGEGVGYVFLVDISKSLKPKQFEQMREAISGLIGNMARKDMAAIITFGKDVKVVCDYTADKNELKTKINALRLVDDLTQLHRGLTKAVELGRRKDSSLPQRKVIITLSDGEDDFAGGMTKDEVIEILKVDRIPIYAIGYYPPPSTPKKDEHLKTLGEFARRSGGELIRANNMAYNEIYKILNDRIRNSFIINLSCDNCTGDGQKSRLQLTLTAGTKQITDGMDVRTLPAAKASTVPPNPTIAQSPSTPAPAAAITAQQLYLIAAITILAALIVIMAMRRRNRLKRFNMLNKTKFYQGPEVNRVLNETPKPSAPHPGVRLTFTVLGGQRNPMTYEALLDRPIVMGRNKAYCAVTIADDEEVSGVHCEISRAGGKYYIKDLGSTNGTLVNGNSLTSVQKINDGDTITLGQTELLISIPRE